MKGQKIKEFVNSVDDLTQLVAALNSVFMFIVNLIHQEALQKTKVKFESLFNPDSSIEILFKAEIPPNTGTLSTE
ncbi:MAG: hypothetical protein ABIO44_05595 [Saprospiraceae bacterium]